MDFSAKATIFWVKGKQAKLKANKYKILKSYIVPHLIHRSQIWIDSQEAPSLTRNRKFGS